MNEEKNNALEPEAVEEVTAEEIVAEETAEEAVIEEAAEVAETEPVAEEVTEVTETEAADDEAAEDTEAEALADAVDEETAELDGETVETDAVIEAEGLEIVEEPKKLSKGVIAAIIAVVVVVAGLIIAMCLLGGDKYSKMYVDVTGTTAGEIAEQLGMEFDDFVDYYDLPKDVSPKTHEYALINLMPASTYIEKVLGTTYEVAHEFFGWDESITGETPIGEAWNKTPLTKYYGEAYVEEVKSLYGLDDSVTGETLYGDVREQIEKAMLEQRLEEEAKAAEATEAATEAAEDAAADEAEEPAEETAAEGAEESAEEPAAE